MSKFLGPKAPVDPSTGKRDWDYTPPNQSHWNESEEDDDDDDFGYDSGYSDPYENNPWDEPIY